MVGLIFPPEVSADWRLCGRDLGSARCSTTCGKGTRGRYPTQEACNAARLGKSVPAAAGSATTADPQAAAKAARAKAEAAKKAKAVADAAAQRKARAAAAAAAAKAQADAAALKKKQADAVKAALEKKQAEETTAAAQKQQEQQAAAELTTARNAAIKAMVDANILLAPMAPGGLRGTVEAGIESVAEALKTGSLASLRTHTEALVQVRAQIEAANKAAAVARPSAAEAPAAAPPPGKRVALVIGNSTYEHVARLPNPANDAADVSAALTRLGFTVRTVEDQGRNALRDALAEFSNDALGADVAVIYYAGHGMEVGRQNYLVPIDAKLETDLRIRFETIPLDDVMAALDGAKGLRLVLLDACRNNPFSASMKVTTASRSIGRGLSRVEPQVGTLVSFAAKEGTTAADGKARNSPYTAALLAHVEQPGVEVNKLFRLVRDRVLAATGGEQEPYTYGSTPAADIYLKP